MNRTSTLALLILSLVLPSCAAYRAQHVSPIPAVKADQDAASPTAGLPPNPEVMATFSTISPELKRVTLVEQVGVYKQDLYAAGKYACCVRPACNQCAIDDGECRCRDRVRTNMPACGECTQAWIEGDGNMPGVDVQKILENLGCSGDSHHANAPAEQPPGPEIP